MTSWKICCNGTAHQLWECIRRFCLWALQICTACEMERERQRERDRESEREKVCVCVRERE